MKTKKRKKRSIVPQTLREHIEILATIPVNEDKFIVNGTSAVTYFKAALKKDPRLEKGDKQKLKQLIIDWLFFSRIIDSYETNDPARREFKAMFLSKYPSFKKRLDRNKLKASHIQNMKPYFDMFTDELFGDNKKLKREWEKLYKVVKTPLREGLSEYQMYELGKRLSYITQVEDLIIDICMNYGTIVLG